MKGNKMALQKTCYIIGPIGKPNTPERKWADFVREHIIEPATTACGFKKPARADDPDKGLIPQDIIQQMFDANLVVADLTDHNGNVYYELGIRHCRQKPAIHIIKEGQLPLFDLGGNKVIFIGEGHLVVTQAIEDIKSRIKAIEKTPEEFYSQVHLHIQLKQLDLFKKSANDKDKIFGESLSFLTRAAEVQMGLLQQLHTQLAAMKIQLPTPYSPYTPTLGPLERIAREMTKEDNPLAQAYREALMKELEGCKESSPTPENKK